MKAYERVVNEIKDAGASYCSKAGYTLGYYLGREDVKRMIERNKLAVLIG